MSTIPVNISIDKFREWLGVDESWALVDVWVRGNDFVVEWAPPKPSGAGVKKPQIGGTATFIPPFMD